MSLGETLTDRRMIAFLVFWVALNAYFGLSSVKIGGEQGGIAWEAHIGGFLCGFSCSASSTRNDLARTSADSLRGRNFPATFVGSCASIQSGTECRSTGAEVPGWRKQQ